MENYYKNQLKRLKKSKYGITVKFTDGKGNTTNNIDLNLESIPFLIDYLDDLLLDEKSKKAEE